MALYTLFSVLIIIISILLILVVLVQNSKGGGLAANFSASNQVMGVRKTTDFLEKATWVLATGLIFFTLLATASIPRSSGERQSRIKDQIDRAIDPSQIPALPTAPLQQAPAQNTPDNK